LTDTKRRNLKPKDKLYKMNDRDGLYVSVTPAGTVSFRHNYSISGRQETLMIGRYGSGSITLAEAREQLSEAKRMMAFIYPRKLQAMPTPELTSDGRMECIWVDPSLGSMATKDVH
jgi:Arm DNA-binding domain